MGDRHLSDLRTAVIGSGFVGAVHMDALRRLGVRLAGLLSRDPATARAAYPGIRIYDSLEALCDDGSIDIVPHHQPELSACGARPGRP